MNRSRPMVNALVVAIVIAILVSAQASAHYLSPSSNNRLKHDVKHLDGFITNLLSNSFLGKRARAANSNLLDGKDSTAFVQGNATVYKAKATRNTDGTTLLFTVPGMGPVSLERNVASVDCTLLFQNNTGQVILRNGMVSGGGTVAPVPPSTDARINAGGTIGLTSTNSQLEAKMANYHISTVDGSKVLIVSAALNEGIPPGDVDDCSTTVVVTHTTI